MVAVWRSLVAVGLIATALCLDVAAASTAFGQQAQIDCKTDAPSGWEVITNASGGSFESFLCNYRVTRRVEGKDFLSGTAITIETYCTTAAGAEAYTGKTGNRGATETKRVDGERLIIEEGKGARTRTGAANPDNPHRNGVFSSFFPDVEFRLFEKEWLALNDQIVATIVVLTNERDAVKESDRFGVDDAELVAAALAERHAARRRDCTVLGTITAPIGPPTTAARPGGGTTGGTSTSTGIGKKGGSRTPAVVAVGAGVAALGGTAIAVNKRRRPKFVPPKVLPDGRSNPWDPSIDEQRRKWDRDKLVWDPDTLSWRDPVDTDFVDLPEALTPVEKAIPEGEVPSQCLETYTTYVRQEGLARDLKRLRDDATTKLEAAGKLLKKNVVRANVQLGVDIGGAIGGMAGSALGAAEAAFRPAISGGVRTPIAEIGQEARTRVGRRVAELENELSAAKSRLAQSQLEMETAGLNRTAVKNAVDLADAEITALERRIAKLQDPPAKLVERRAKITAEQLALRKELEEVKLKGTQQADPFLKFYHDAQYEFFRTEGTPFVERGREISRLEAEDAARPGLMSSTELGELEVHVRQEVSAGRMSQAEADTIVRNAEANTVGFTARAKELKAARAALKSESEAAFDRYLKSRPGYRDDFRTVDDAHDVKERAKEISTRLKELTGEENKVENEINDFRDENRAEVRRAQEDLSSARERHQAALEKQKQLDSNELGVEKDKAAVDVLEKQLSEHTQQLNEIEHALVDMSAGKTPGVLPAAALGAILAWLAPGAAAVTAAGLLAAKGYDALGIGMQSPQEIMQILLQNKADVITLQRTAQLADAQLDAVMSAMRPVAEHLRQCMKANTSQVAP